MSRTHGNAEYPFSFESGDRGNAFNSKVVRSQKGWIYYWLTPAGWSYLKESAGSGILGEGDKTVIQVLRETELPDVTAFTGAALDAGWISESHRDEIRSQLDKAERILNSG